MEDRLREIEGTLARASERKNTVLYKLAKRRNQEERLARLGIKKVPANPRSVSDIGVVKYALAQLRQEVGDKIAKIRNESLVSLERDGEAVVRAKNDAINELLSRKDQWERRLCELTQKEGGALKPRKKTFWGCAKLLPEAAASANTVSGVKRARDVNVDGDGDRSERSSSDELLSLDAASDESSSGDDGTKASDGVSVEHANPDYLAAIAALRLRESESQLLEEEKLAEREYRQAHPFDVSFLSQFRQTATTDNDSYLDQLRAVHLPEESYLAKQAVEQRKAALQQKIAALRKGD